MGGLRPDPAGETYTSTACAINGQTTFASDYPNAFYCPDDPNVTDNGFIAIPVLTMAKMWSGDIFGSQVSDLSRVGDFAAAMIMAHEFGHHIQDELAGQLGWAPPGNPDIELIADCFAGVWAYSVFLDSYLEDGDIDEALHALAVIGDDTGDHGTGAERNSAFLTGYTGSQGNPQGGVPMNCVTAYWPSAGQ